jgi:hypothetical protein
MKIKENIKLYTAIYLSLWKQRKRSITASFTANMAPGTFSTSDGSFFFFNLPNGVVMKTLSDGFSVLVHQLQGKRKGMTRQDGARPAIFPIRR